MCAPINQHSAEQRDDQHERPEEDRPEDCELRAQELAERTEVQRKAVDVGVRLGVAIAHEIMGEIPNQVGRVDRERQGRGGEKTREMPALVFDDQQKQQRR